MSEPISQLGNLSNCVMDSDSGAIGRARRLRRKAFVGSLVLEAALVAAMLLWPLLAPAVLPAQMAVTPVPPYRGDTAVIRNGHPREAAGPTFAVTLVPLHPALGRPRSVEPGAPGETPPTIGDGSLGFGPGLDIPGASRDSRAIEVPSPTVPKGPLKVSAGVMAALLVHRVQPDYPALAIAMGLSGTVELQARIGTDGTVQELEVVTGNPILARAAVQAVEQWRYQPTRLNGQPVEVETHITVTFSVR
ncbi:MAG TPA: energy transducer TonB [Candidatus Acidoferrales bacterium]|jgi:protein TonB|nr:energy transducer TonB [Candidatus Acidoferrales bacterium]